MGHLIKHNIKKTDQLDINNLYKRLRPIDQAECFYMLGLYPRQGLEYSVKNSSSSYSFIFDGQVEAIMGLIPISKLYGWYTPWFVASDWVDKNKLEFMKLTNKYFIHLIQNTRFLINYILESNKNSINWLKYIGFQFSKRKFIIGGKNWIKFYYIKLEK